MWMAVQESRWPERNHQRHTAKKNLAEEVNIFLRCRLVVLLFKKSLLEIHRPSLPYLNTILFQLHVVVVVVVVVVTPSLPRDGGTARTVIHVHAVNLIDIRLGKR